MSGVYSTVSVDNSTSTGIDSVIIFTTGQFASVLRQMASINCFLALAATFTLSLTPFNIGESAGFSASATTSTLSISTLLCLATSAKIVAAQSENAIIASSNAVGPVSSPPLAVGKSQTMVWVLELSTIVRTFSTSLAVDLCFGIVSYFMISLSLELDNEKHTFCGTTSLCWLRRVSNARSFEIYMGAEAATHQQ